MREREKERGRDVERKSERESPNKPNYQKIMINLKVPIFRQVLWETLYLT